MPASADLASRHDWRDIFALLDTALELEQAQHDAWLEALPAESARLSPLLKDLLRAHAGIGTGDFMHAPANFVLPAGPSPPEPAAHSLVGPYRLLREIGTGGMASVWLAERADGLLDRQVALKLPHAGRGMASLAERMARERNILASLTHPNIARLYDAGITADGRPFLALEYVDGRPIDEYAAAADLEMGARVELILQVARAVAYAHSRLVVHRDLKPSNILVDAQGAVHLLDFGIARLVDPQVEDGAAGVRPVLAAEAQGRVLTPDYASPEQIRGEPIGTASDVYSLGIVAYELWAEVKPYKLKAEGGDALSAAIAAVELRRASTAAANPGARDALKGDLDAILDRALKHDVAARYPTAEALAQDLERHLAHRPVRARPDAPGYRLARFLRRNWLAVAAAAAVSVSLIAGISIATWQAREALAQANRAQRVKDFIGTLFATADPYVVGKPGGTVRDLLDAASARIERELQREPAMAAELLGLLANSYRKLGEVDHALGAAQRADALAAQAYPESHAMRVRAMRVLAQALNDKGNDEEARHLLRAALAMQLRQGSDPAELAQTMMALASAVLDQGHEAEAVVLLRDAVQRLERAYGSDSPLTIQARGELSNKLLTANLRQEALQVAEQSVQAARALYQTPDHPAVVEQLSHYAYALSVNGRAREAREQWQAIVAADRKTFNPRGPQVSLALEALGRSQQSLGELNDALASFEEALAIMQGFGAQGGGELAIRHFSIGRVALQARQGQRALDRLDQAIAIGAKAYGADSARVRDAGNFRAEALVRVGRLADARAVLDQRTAEDRARDAPDLWRELRILALLDLARSDFAAAFAHLTEADVLARQKGDGSPKALAQLRAELGRAALEVGRIDEAVALLEEASAALGKMEPTATPQQAEVWLALGRARLRQGRVAEGLAQIEAADAFWRAFEPEHAQAGETAYWLGHAQAQAGNKRAAQLQLARATPLLAASTWPMLQQLMTVVRN